MKKLIIFLLVFCIFVPTAFSRVGYIGLGPQASLMKRADAVDDSWMFGAAARINFLMLGAEATVGYVAEEYNDNISATTVPVTVSALFYPLPFAYVLAGMGWYNTSAKWEGEIDGSPIDEDVIEFKDKSKTTGAHVGLGVEFPFGTNARFCGDVRYNFQDYELKDLPTMDEYDYDYFTINFTLFFLF